MSVSRRYPRCGVRLAVIALTLVVVSCGSGKRPVLQPLVDLPLQARTPVIMIPGLTGTRLRDTETGKLQWGNARRVFLPRDRCHACAIPINPDSGKLDTVVAEHTVWRVKALGLFPVKAFISFVNLLENNGYQLGDLDAPRPDDTLFFLTYDWRRDMEDSVQRLSEQLERLRLARGDDVLHVTLVAQSGGGRIGRWYLRYGDATIEGAEAGLARPPQSVVVDKMILVSTANGGAVRVFAEIHKGRRYVPLFGRLFSAETFFTFSGLFDELPVYPDQFFVDREGRPLDVDLFDADNWQRYGWSIYRKRPRRNADRRPDLFGDADDRAAHLKRALDHSRRYQLQLQRDDATAPPARYYQIQSSFRPSPARALLHQKKNGSWITAFQRDGWVDHDPHLPAIVTAPGDGHVTDKSLRVLAPQEHAAMARETAWVDGSHFGIIHEPRSQRALLEFLLDP